MQLGKRIVSKLPKHNPEQSAEQKEQVAKFQEAVIYAKTAIKDANIKTAYAAEAEEGESAYNVAVADLLNAPDIEEIDLNNYTGKVGDTITIKATDDFKVVEVTDTINNADGSLVETGNAILSPNGLEWVYTATTINADLNGDKITVQASDLPGNLSEKQQNLA